MTDLPIFAPALPEMFLACAAMGLMMVGVYANKERALKLVTSLAILALVLTGGLVLEGGSETRLAFGGLFRADGFGLYMKLLVLLGSILTILMSDGYIRRENMARFEYPVLIVFATLGMLMMISANGLISLYIGLELQSLALYVIASFQRDSVRSTEAGLKYFVLGSVSSGLLLYGCSLIYGFSGTTSFDGLAQVFSMSGDVPTGVVIGIVFLCAGLAFKISAVPFHMWTPDVYEGAPTPVTSFFAVAPKIAAIALFVRVMIGPFGGLEEQWRQVIVAISVGSMFVGAFAALVQTNIKRLMAYSSIGHIGYALIGLAAGTEEGTRGILIYMAIYLFMNVGTFAVILSMKVKDRMVENISDLAGLSKTRPGMAFALLVFMFSMAGVPPMAGFIGKIAIFYSAVNAGLVPLAVIGVIASVVSAFYYLRIVKVMYFDDPAEAFDRPEGRAIPAILVITTAFTALFILWPDPVVNSAAHAAGTLFGG